MNKKQRVIGRLKVLFPKANLTKERLNAFAERLIKKVEDDADDDAIDAVINDFNDNSLVTIEDIAREDDRQRGIQARLEKLTNNRGGNTEEEEEEEEDEGNPTPSGSKKNSNSKEDALLKAIQALTAKVDNIEKGKVADSKKQTATQLFEASDVLKKMKPELKQRWLDRINVDSETPIEDQIEGLELEYSELVQVNANNGDYAGSPPSFTSGIKKFSDEQADSIVDELI